MGPDFLWVTVFALGGGAVGLVTSLVGLKKGRELWLWMAFYVFVMVAVLLLRIEHPLWTVLLGSLGAGLVAATVQTAFMGSYARKNVWFDPGDKPPRKVAAGFFTFTLATNLLFGVLLGAVAWGLGGLL